MEVVRQLPAVEAMVVGGYTEEHYSDQYYRTLLASYPDIRDRVHFVGEVTWDQVPTHLAAADIFVFPSKFEGMPHALLAAMASGLPVVVSDVPPHRELIQHGRTGFLARDPLEMARLVATLANHEDLRGSVGEAGRAYVRENLASEACTQAFLDLYKRLIAGELGRVAPAEEPVELSNTHRDCAISADHMSTYSSIARSTENRSTAIRRAPSRSRRCNAESASISRRRPWASSAERTAKPLSPSTTASSVPGVSVVRIGMPIAMSSGQTRGGAATARGS